MAVLFYRHEQELRLRLEERQFVIEQTFNAIHSGPLQTLVWILRTAQQQATPSPLLPDLQRLSQELRAVYGSVQREASAIELVPQAPLHELLYTVYCNTLERELPYFNTIRHKIVQFDPLNTSHLRLEHKRGLCRFLEEALCNVGKHALGATRLTIICTQEENQQVIRVIDNGREELTEMPDLVESGQSRSTLQPLNTKPLGLGTQLAKNLAKQLGGTFRRYPNQPTGTVCELTWSAKRWWFW